MLSRTPKGRGKGNIRGTELASVVVPCDLPTKAGWGTGGLSTPLRREKPGTAGALRPPDFLPVRETKNPPGRMVSLFDGGGDRRLGWNASSHVGQVTHGMRGSGETRKKETRLTGLIIKEKKKGIPIFLKRVIGPFGPD